MFTVYKVINKITEEYYIGVHKTDDPNDEYFGSGLRIKRSIQKYGKSYFAKEILFVFETKEEAFQKETNLLRDLLNEKHCLNIAQGGMGGNNFGGKHHTEETKRIIGLASSKVKRIRSKISIEKEKNTRLAAYQGNWFSDDSVDKMKKSKLNKPRSQETKDKIRQKMKGRILSEETKNKIRKGHLKRHSNLENIQLP